MSRGDFQAEVLVSSTEDDNICWPGTWEFMGGPLDGFLLGADQNFMCVQATRKGKVHGAYWLDREFKLSWDNSQVSTQIAVENRKK